MDEERRRPEERVGHGLHANTSGRIFRVGIVLDFVGLTTRTEGPHGAYVREPNKVELTAIWGGIERLARRTMPLQEGGGCIVSSAYLQGSKVARGSSIAPDHAVCRGHRLHSNTPCAVVTLSRVCCGDAVSKRVLAHQLSWWRWRWRCWPCADRGLTAC